MFQTQSDYNNIKINEELIKTLDKDKQYLLKQMYSITEAESPGDMYDIAVESLKHFKLKEAPQNEY